MRSLSPIGVQENAAGTSASSAMAPRPSSSLVSLRARLFDAPSSSILLDSSVQENLAIAEGTSASIAPPRDSVLTSTSNSFARSLDESPSSSAIVGQSSSSASFYDTIDQFDIFMNLESVWGEMIALEVIHNPDDQKADQDGLYDFVVLASSAHTFVIDARKIGVEYVHAALNNATTTIKVMFDAKESFTQMLDIQLVGESKTNTVNISLSSTAKLFHVMVAPDWPRFPHVAPVALQQKITNALARLHTLVNFFPLVKSMGVDDLNRCILVSTNRSSEGRQRKFWFRDFELCSASLAGSPPRIPVLHADVQSLTVLMPPHIAVTLPTEIHAELVDVVLDRGRFPLAYLTGRRRMQLSPHLVTQDDVDFVIQSLGGLSKFHADNRAGLRGQLHRISALRNNEQDIFGLTIRVGRALEGYADGLLDVLRGSRKSILFCGLPGSGKTTVIRDASRVLSESGENVFVIDTSNLALGGRDE